MESKKVLIVEDDTSLQQLIKKLVEMRNATATIVGSGKEANLLIKEPNNRYDLVFLDLILPEVTGWDVLETLKSNPGTRDTPIVIFTGIILSEKEHAKMLLKVSAIIIKNGFTLEAFNAVLDRWLPGSAGALRPGE